MKNTQDLTGKIALVTGATGGLGESFAGALAAAGAHVVLAARRKDALDRVAGSIANNGGAASATVMDVLSTSSVRQAFDQIEAECGVPDIIVCNAGVAITRPAIEVSDDDWDRVLGTNLTGCWRVAREAAMRLIAQKKTGSIINITSILGTRVAGAVMPYAVAKAGLEQMTRALALEWARYGIRVNAIAPGYIKTDINHDFFESDAGQALVRRVPMRRLGDMKELHGALLLLASDLGSYMTGSTIVADGGHLQSSL